MTIQEMSVSPQHVAAYRVRMIDALIRKGFVFRFSRGGDYRALRDEESDKLILALS